MTRIKRSFKKIAILALATACVGSPFSLRSARADQTPSELKFANGHFEPSTLTVPAGQPTSLMVTNSGDSAIEFESFELNRERVVQPGQTITVKLPKLDPGQYHFFDDFHHDVAQGTITAR